MAVTAFENGIRTQIAFTETDGDLLTTTFGASGQRETFMFEDLSDTRDWSQFTDQSDSDGLLATRTYIFDDGSTSTFNFLDGGCLGSNARYKDSGEKQSDIPAESKEESLKRRPVAKTLPEGRVVGHDTTPRNLFPCFMNF